MSSNRQQGMGRREFLIASSASALATATLGPSLFAAAVASPPKRLAVGYAGLEDLTALTPASRIPAGDRGFIEGGARIRVNGASGGSAVPRERRGVELLAHFEYSDGAERLTTPFCVWGCSRISGAQGSPIAFTVPVNEVQKVKFTVGLERGAPGGAPTRRDALSFESTESVALPLTLGLRPEDPLKLARGFYVVVPLFDGDSEPRWSGQQLRLGDGRWRLVDAAGTMAGYEHFVLRVDYAKA
jgi:hypothetical protein